MPSKFDSLLPSLKPLPVADQTYQDKVNATKDLFTDRAPTALAKAYTAWRARKDAIEATLKDANLHLEAVTQLLIESQDRGDEGWGQYGATETTLRLPNGDKIETRSEPYGVVKDKEAFRVWCMTPTHICMKCGERESAPYHVDQPVIGHTNMHQFQPGGGYENKMQLWPTTMNGIVKERAVVGDPLPAGTDVFRKDSVRYTPMKAENVSEAVKNHQEGGDE